MSTRKYLVGIREIHVRTVEVEAVNSQDAMEKAENQDMDTVDEIMTEFSHTMCWDSWTVEEKQKCVWHMNDVTCEKCHGK